MDEAEVYKRQTLVVENLLNHHPEFGLAEDPSFTSSERRIFATVFQPDWDFFDDDYRKAYEYFSTKQAQTYSKAKQILKKWLLKYRVDLTGLGV